MKNKCVILILVGSIILAGRLFAGGQELAGDPGDSIRPVYAVSLDHLGIILWGQRTFERVLDSQLVWLERHPGYSIGMDNEAYTYDYLAENAPDLLGKVRNATAKFHGRLGISACTYGQPLSMFINEESNIRQLTYAVETIENRLGLKTTVYIMSEHPFHAQMPQLLAGSGFEGAVLRTHYMMYGYNPELNQPVCWWKGVDGSRIPALPTYKGQLVSPLSYWKIPGYTSTMDNRILTDAISESCQLTLTDFSRQIDPGIKPLVATRADDARSHENLIIHHRKDNHIKWITAEDIFKVLPEPVVDFPVQANDFKVRMPWGYCGNWIWNMCREAETKVLIAERLNAIPFSLNEQSYEKELTRHGRACW